MVNFELSNRGGSQEVLHNIDSQVADHWRVMVRVVPSPVWGPFVVIEENPLHTFKILLEHLFPANGAFISGNIELHFGLIVELLCELRIFRIFLDKFCHEFQICVFHLLIQRCLSIHNTVIGILRTLE
jgi:hypothetical protein